MSVQQTNRAKQRRPRRGEQRYRLTIRYLTYCVDKDRRNNYCRTPHAPREVLYCLASRGACGVQCVSARLARVAGASGKTTIQALSYQKLPKSQALDAENPGNGKVVILCGGGHSPEVPPSRSAVP